MSMCSASCFASRADQLNGVSGPIETREATLFVIASLTMFYFTHVLLYPRPKFIAQPYYNLNATLLN